MQQASPVPGVEFSDINSRDVRRSFQSNIGFAQPSFYRSTPSASRQGHLRFSKAKGVLLPAGKVTYVPQLRPPIRLQTRSTLTPPPDDPRSQRKVLSKYLLVDGSVSFALGLKSGDGIVPEPNEVSLDQVLNYVTPRELERFETEEFLKEDEQEEEFLRLAAIRKPKGRPVGWRADLGLTYAEFVESNGGLLQPVNYDDALLEEISSITESGVPALSHGQTHTTRTRDSGPKPPVHLGRRGRPRVYSMVAAAGLRTGNGSSDDTSREITPIPVANNAYVDVGGPPSKKRRIDNSTGTTTTTSFVKPAYLEMKPSDSQTMGPMGSGGKPMVVVSTQYKPNKSFTTSIPRRKAPLAGVEDAQRGSSLGGQGNATDPGNKTLGPSRGAERLQRPPKRISPSRLTSSRSSSTEESSDLVNHPGLRSIIIAEDYKPVENPTTLSPRTKQGSPKLEPSLARNFGQIDKDLSPPTAIMPSLRGFENSKKSKSCSPPPSFGKSDHINHNVGPYQSHSSKTINVWKEHPATSNTDAGLTQNVRQRPLSKSSRDFTHFTTPKGRYFSPFHTIRKYFTKRSPPKLDEKHHEKPEDSDRRPSAPLVLTDAAPDHISISSETPDPPPNPNTKAQPFASLKTISSVVTDQLDSPMMTIRKSSTSVLEQKESQGVSDNESDASESTSSSYRKIIGASITCQPYGPTSNNTKTLLTSGKTR